jgi:hypothetical protein
MMNYGDSLLNALSLRRPGKPKRGIVVTVYQIHSISFCKELLAAPVSSLGDMVREKGDDDPA